MRMLSVVSFGATSGMLQAHKVGALTWLYISSCVWSVGAKRCKLYSIETVGQVLKQDPNKIDDICG